MYGCGPSPWLPGPRSALGRPADIERAETMLEKAEDTAGRLGAEGITREVAECHAALAAVSG
jgi:hypothetical protein